MSNSTNVEKNNNSKKFNLIAILDESKRARILFLITLGISGLGIRLCFFPYDVPLFDDSHGYFWHAIDMSILKQLPPDNSLVNIGWPSFLSIIFQLMNSDNFLDYHNMQRFVGIMFSVATLIPVYVLCSKYFKKSYSLFGAAFFIFEPRLIQNSFLGTPESMYIFLMATLLCLFLSHDFKKIYLAFGIMALLAIVRYEGLLMIIPISIVFFIRFRKQKKDLIKYGICISIFILILFSMEYLRNDITEQNVFVSHISAGPAYYQASIEEKSSTLADFIYLGIIDLIRYVGWSQIPYFIIFTPIGIMFIFKSLDYKKILIILSIVLMLIPAFYAYSRGFPEIKYLYVLYPIFCVLACFTFKIFFEKFHRKNLIFILIIIVISTSSIVFVEWKSIDNEHYREAFKVLSEISDKNISINTDFGKYGGAEITYIHWAQLHNVEDFPILKMNVPEIPIKYVKLQYLDENKEIRSDYIDKTKINTFDEYLMLLKHQNISHLLIDEKNGVRLINDNLRKDLVYVFHNEEEFPFLIKEYDSNERGFNYHLKLFKINYEMLESEIKK